MRIQGKEEVDIEAFRLNLQKYLNVHYQVDEIHSNDNETIANLSATQQGEQE